MKLLPEVALDERRRYRFLQQLQEDTNPITVGLVFLHLKKDGEEECEGGVVLWEPVGDGRPLFTCIDKHDLTIEPHIHCVECGERGKITNGKWESL